MSANDPGWGVSDTFCRVFLLPTLLWPYGEARVSGGVLVGSGLQMGASLTSLSKILKKIVMHHEMWRISGPRGAQAFVFAAISSILFTVLNTLATIFATCAWVTKCCVLFPADSFRALIYYKSICLTLTENRLVGTEVHAAPWLQDKKKTLNWSGFLFCLFVF